MPAEIPTGTSCEAHLPLLTCEVSTGFHYPAAFGIP